jgi:hypothetical protein
VRECVAPRWKDGRSRGRDEQARTARERERQARRGRRAGRQGAVGREGGRRTQEDGGVCVWCVCVCVVCPLPPVLRFVRFASLRFGRLVG